MLNALIVKLSFNILSIGVNGISIQTLSDAEAVYKKSQPNKENITHTFKIVSYLLLHLKELH